MRKRLIILLILLLVFVVVGSILYFSISRIEKSLEDLLTLLITTPNLSEVKSGTYLGSYESFPISVKVSVTIVDGAIGNLVLLEHNHGQGQDAEAIIEEVLSQQTLDVETISGATYSSIVILKAIESALLQGTMR